MSVAGLLSCLQRGCSKGGVSGEQQRWLRLRSLPRGARPLLLRSRLLAFVGFPLSPSLLGNKHFFEARSLSVRDARRVHLVFGCRCVSKETVSSNARAVLVFMLTYYTRVFTAYEYDNVQ